MVSLFVVCFVLAASLVRKYVGPWNRTHGFWGFCVFSCEVGMATKLFGGKLPFRATGAELEGLFGQVGRITAANVISEKFSGQSRRFGFVEMDSPQEAQAAIETCNGYQLHGRVVIVNEAKPQAPRGGGRARGE